MQRPPFQMNARAYEDMLQHLNSLHFTDKAGEAEDMGFIQQAEWLTDSAVIENVVRRKGAWEIHLLFAHFRRPLTFLSRFISAHSCPRRAGIFATYMRRLAAKDQRGTLKIRPEDLPVSGQ